jgi:hypothetical protein
MMGGAGRTSGGRGVHAIQDGRGRGIEYFRVVLAEFQRATAAEQRYEYLRRAGTAALARDGVVRADVPRRIFDEFYSSSAEPRSGVPWKIENLWGARRATSPLTNHRTRRGRAKLAAVAWRYAAGRRAT